MRVQGSIGRGSLRPHPNVTSKGFSGRFSERYVAYSLLSYQHVGAGAEEWSGHIPGDTGYVAWAAALLFFMNEIKAMSTRFYGDETVANGLARLEEIEGSFLWFWNHLGLGFLVVVVLVQ
ncbi:hypothetical protein CFD26_103441 [Aspergillus turcosus]|uniref:Uncharacterized protein n=1 Tax=Aspergillus turcosus TaxID=1245748 RepID=A0A3R7HR44_9EURO|nr:hypothetical protein CFD26_103441 [Aspergillus turcosus]